MHILVLNCGSSSVKAEVVHSEAGTRAAALTIERVTTAPEGKWADGTAFTVPQPGHAAALQTAIQLLNERCQAQGVTLTGVGHRVAHGGDRFAEPVMIDAAVLKAIEDLVELAPLHNPANLAGIAAAQAHLPSLPQVAVFDTAFHATIPPRARVYGLPKDLAQKYHLQRYGFHGTSHQYVAAEAAAYLRTDVRQLRIITCHLGNGASVAAVEYGRSVETSMGMTPLEGLMMGTRSGDLDPGALLYLMEKEGLTAAQMTDLLNKQAGLKGVSGLSHDVRDLQEHAAQGNADAQLALLAFAHRLRKYIGAYAAVMGGVDAIIFTAGIGENSAQLRHQAAQRLDFLGAALDEDVNRAARVTAEKPVADVSTAYSRCKILVVRTDEQRAIARQTAAVITQASPAPELPPIPVAVSARHAHLTQEMVETLFGKGYQLTVRNPLSQPGQWAANETVNLVGPKNRIDKVRILGPTRPKTQIEISRTDEFFLGIDAPVRESGKTENSPGITLEGPTGTHTLAEGVICAWRHIHMHPDDASAYGVHDKDIVDIEINHPERPVVFGNVLIRVSEQFRLEMHIDTDEANAAEVSPGTRGVLEQASHGAVLKKRQVQGILASR